MAFRETDDPTLYRNVRENNLMRQYDMLEDMVEIGLCKGIEAFDKYM